MFMLSACFNSMRTVPVCSALVCTLCIACAGCGSSTIEDQPSGSLAMNLELPGDIVINEVIYELSGGGFADSSGVLDVSGTDDFFAATLPLAAGFGYLLELTAPSVDGSQTCSGSATFDVFANQTTQVPVSLGCTTQGDAEITGTFDTCPQVTSASASARNIELGETIELTVEASDPDDGDAVNYAWTAGGGSLGTPSSPTTTYTCESAGRHNVSVAVTSSSTTGCSGGWSAAITCGEPAGNGGGGLICEPTGVTYLPDDPDAWCLAGPVRSGCYLGECVRVAAPDESTEPYELAAGDQILDTVTLGDEVSRPFEVEGGDAADVVELTVDGGSAEQERRVQLQITCTAGVAINCTTCDPLTSLGACSPSTPYEKLFDIGVGETELIQISAAGTPSYAQWTATATTQFCGAPFNGTLLPGPCE